MKISLQETPKRFWKRIALSQSNLWRLSGQGSSFHVQSSR